MKRSSSALVANRRSLILHQHALLSDPDVVAFLDNTATPLYARVAEKLIRANEPALLLELIWVTQRSTMTLHALDEEDNTVALPAGLLEYLLQHIDQAPCITQIDVETTALSSACCALLQTVLADPACTITTLSFSQCSFVDAHVQFPLRATSVQTLMWLDPLTLGGASPMGQMLTALASWSRLQHVRLTNPEDPLDFAAITQMLLLNPNVTSLYLVCDVAPAMAGDPAHQPHQDPALLLDLLMNDKLRLTQLSLRLLDTHDGRFNQYCLERLSQCLMTNTTLESLYLPGIQMCTQNDLNQFNATVNTNHSLISLTPLDAFDRPMLPHVRRNQRQRFWFTQDFVLGAAEAFLQLTAVPSDLKTAVTKHLAPTAAERAYSGALMALICKSTHQGAVRLRSAGLCKAALIYLRDIDRPRCLELLNALLQQPHLDLLPEDRRQVVDYAKAHNRLSCLPPGYAH